MMMTEIDYNLTLASLHAAEHAIREEPYARLPALAGTLAIAIMRFEGLRAEAMLLQKHVGKLRAAIESLPCNCVSDVPCYRCVLIVETETGGKP